MPQRLALSLVTDSRAVRFLVSSRPSARRKLGEIEPLWELETAVEFYLPAPAPRELGLHEVKLLRTLSMSSMSKLKRFSCRLRTGGNRTNRMPCAETSQHGHKGYCTGCTFFARCFP